MVRFFYSVRMTLGLKKGRGRNSLHHHYVTFLGAEPLTESSSEPGVAIKQEPQEEDLAKPPRAPRTLSSFFSEFVPPSPPRGCAGRRQGGCLLRKLQIPPVFPRVGKSNSCLSWLVTLSGAMGRCWVERVVGWGTGPTISWLHSQPPGSQQSKKK